jgi:hypothetical protein
MQNRWLNDKCINDNKGSLGRVKMCGKGEEKCTDGRGKSQKSTYNVEKTTQLIRIYFHVRRRAGQRKVEGGKNLLP